MDDELREPGARIRRRVLPPPVAGCAVLGGVPLPLPWGRGAHTPGPGAVNPYFPPLPAPRAEAAPARLGEASVRAGPEAS